MAIRARSLLRKWFGRGQYPTAEQFSDFFDSFVHRDEDKIAIDKVDELPDRLNGKYGQDDGVRLEGQLEQLSDTLSGHIIISDDHFIRLDEGLAAETARAKGGRGDYSQRSDNGRCRHAAICENLRRRESSRRSNPAGTGRRRNPTGGENVHRCGNRPRQRGRGDYSQRSDNGRCRHAAICENLRRRESSRRSNPARTWRRRYSTVGENVHRCGNRPRRGGRGCYSQ